MHQPPSPGALTLAMVLQDRASLLLHQMTFDLIWSCGMSHPLWRKQERKSVVPSMKYHNILITTPPLKKKEAPKTDEFSLEDFVPVIIAGIIPIHVLVVPVLISNQTRYDQTLFASLINLCSDLAIILRGLRLVSRSGSSGMQV